MPWDIKKDDRCPASKPWAVVNKDTNRLVGCHVDKDSARQQQKALYANVPASSRDLFEVGSCLELAQALAQSLDNATRILESIDPATLPDAVGAARTELLSATQTAQQLIDELQPDAGLGEDDVYESESLAYDLEMGLPYIIIFSYRSDGGPMLVGTFPTRDACIEYCHMLEPFESNYELVPVSTPFPQ